MATDGHRLAMYDAGVSWPLSAGIVPRKTVGILLAAMKAGGNGAIMAQECIGVNRQMMRFIHGDWTLTTKLIDGTYPKYQKVIPAASDAFTCTLSHAQINRIPYKRGMVRLDAGAGMISFIDPERTKITMPLQGKGHAVGFNIAYLKNFTRQHGTIEVSGLKPMDPNIIRSDDPAFMGVLMPMYL